MSAAKNQAKMASDNQDRSDKKEVMQSNLPLLFANGSPISLESMNLVSILTFLLVTTYHRPYRRDISDYCNIGGFFSSINSRDFYYSFSSANVEKQYIH